MVQDEALYKCRLLLFEDCALEAQPWHEVAFDVGRNYTWSEAPPPLRSIHRMCSKESLLVGGPSFSFLETFGEKAGASVV